jgi:beta-lactamase class A
MKSTGIIVATGICIVSCVIGYIFWIQTDHNTASTVDTKNQVSDEIKWVREWGYKFISPLLECETSSFANNRKYIPFEKNAINAIRDQIQNKNPDIKFSLYFRNLNNGPWFGINENEQFFPASLIKLPILIMYLKWAEIDPSILLRTLKVQELSDVPQVYKPEKKLEKDKTYAVKDLLEYLIRYSENNAIPLLLSILPEDIQVHVFQDLGVPIPTKEGYQITTKDYASFFRILYNASYLSKSLSENALALLSETTFEDGIRGNIPQEITIAHKFGEREIIGEDNKILHQLHDCWIVYYPGYPYLICVMTKWEDVPMQRLAWVIQKSSTIIYNEISNRYPYKIGQQK